MNRAEIFARGKALVNQLDAEGIPNEDQVPLLGGALTAALLSLPSRERVTAGMAHMIALEALLLAATR